MQTHKWTRDYVDLNKKLAFFYWGICNNKTGLRSEIPVQLDPDVIGIIYAMLTVPPTHLYNTLPGRVLIQQNSADALEELSALIPRIWTAGANTNSALILSEADITVVPTNDHSSVTLDWGKDIDPDFYVGMRTPSKLTYVVDDLAAERGSCFIEYRVSMVEVHDSGYGGGYGGGSYGAYGSYGGGYDDDEYYEYNYNSEADRCLTSSAALDLQVAICEKVAAYDSENIQLITKEYYSPDCPPAFMLDVNDIYSHPYYNQRAAQQPNLEMRGADWEPACDRHSYDAKNVYFVKLVVGPGIPLADYGKIRIPIFA